ncbi:MAG TPA: 3-phosphoshikimate 1-carboxyvinyltransferase [Vicinamibacterales bacterium]
MQSPAGLSVVVRPAGRAISSRQVRVPGDKSISHRYAMLAALADGESVLENYAPGADCRSTLSCLGQLGVAITVTPVAGTGARVTIQGRGVRGLRAAPGPIDAGNSGSTMRMMAGILAAHPFTTTMVGDASLSRRPMRRVIVPLSQMGARLEAPDGRPPLTIHGADLHGISYTPEVPSAQVKSAVLLAGLQASGSTTVQEVAATRDHTERALRAFGASVEVDGLRVTVQGGQRLSPRRLLVPGDISSAAFWACAAAALEGSSLEIVGVGLNPSRVQILDALRSAGAEVETAIEQEGGLEPMGRIRIGSGTRRALTITPELVPGLIDELPVLAALATHGREIHVTGAAELRTKESDRITALVTGLRAMGADAEELPDGFRVRGARPLAGGCEVEAAGDHRLAMAFAIAALGARQPVQINGAEAVDVSYPGFFDVLSELCG